MTTPHEEPILLREYGRNIHAMVAHMKTVEDREQRSRMARTIIELMRMLNPEPGNDTADYYHKLWDHLYAMAGYDVDIEVALSGAYARGKRPPALRLWPPPAKTPSNKTYGRNLQLLVDKVAATEDPEEREAGIITIGRLIKGFYAAYNREVIDSRTALDLIVNMSNGKLTMDLARVETEGLFNPPRDFKLVNNFQNEQPERPERPQGQGQGGKKKFFNRGGQGGQAGGGKRKRY